MNGERVYKRSKLTNLFQQMMTEMFTPEVVQETMQVWIDAIRNREQWAIQEALNRGLGKAIIGQFQAQLDAAAADAVDEYIGLTMEEKLTMLSLERKRQAAIAQINNEEQDQRSNSADDGTGDGATSVVSLRLSQELPGGSDDRLTASEEVS
jgi:hypothetical protein